MYISQFWCGFIACPIIEIIIVVVVTIWQEWKKSKERR